MVVAQGRFKIGSTFRPNANILERSVGANKDKWVILHGPENIAGVPGLIARGQRELGYDAISVCHQQPTFEFRSDLIFGARGQPNGRGFLETLSDVMFKADTIHVYFGRSFLGSSLWDARLATKLKKRVFHTFLGCDARNKAIRLPSQDLSMCTQCWPHACSANRTLAIDVARASGEAIFVSTPDLVDEIPDAHYIPLAIDASQAQTSSYGHYKGPSNGEPLRVLHAPTDRLKKGTQFLLDAVEGISKAGGNIELVLVENQPQEAMHAIVQTCHVAVDQLMAGVYGTFAAEAMAFGLPTIARIDDRYRSFYPEDLPIISANPNSIQECLLSMLYGADDLEALSQKSRAYSLREHDHVAVAKRICGFY